jgi:hypothetical protein
MGQLGLCINQLFFPLKGVMSRHHQGRCSKGVIMHCHTRYLCIGLASVFSIIFTREGYAQLVQPRNDPKNTFNSNCNDFNSYAIQTGPTDAENITYPNIGGYTIPTTKYSVSWKGDPPTVRRTSGGFEACIKNVKVTPTFSIEFEMDILRWSPSASISPSCSQENADWTNRILNHENDHIQHDRDYIASKNQTWDQDDFHPDSCQTRNTKNKPIQAAKDAVNLLIDVHFFQLSGDMDNEMKQIEDQWDQSHTVALLNCQICMPHTYCPCVDPPNGKPRNYSSEGECVVHCPEGLACYPVQCTAPP